MLVLLPCTRPLAVQHLKNAVPNFFFNFIIFVFLYFCLVGKNISLISPSVNSFVVIIGNPCLNTQYNIKDDFIFRLFVNGHPVDNKIFQDDLLRMFLSDV